MVTPDLFLLAPLPSLEEVRRERGRRGKQKERDRVVSLFCMNRFGLST
jgi:hypothetical protein